MIKTNPAKSGTNEELTKDGHCKLCPDCLKKAYYILKGGEQKAREDERAKCADFVSGKAKSCNTKRKNKDKLQLARAEGIRQAYSKDFLVKLKMSKLDQLLLRISDAMKIKSRAEGFEEGFAEGLKAKSQAIHLESAGKGRSHASAHKTGNMSNDPAPAPSNTFKSFKNDKKRGCKE